MRVHRRACSGARTAIALGTVILGAVSLAAAGALQNSGAADAPSFDDLYAEGQRRNADVRTITARFTETTSSALLEQPLVERGMLFVERETPRIALRYDGTDRILVIDGDRMTTAWPSRQILQTQNIRSTRRRIQSAFEDTDASELKKGFEITLRSASERPGTHEIALVPTRKQIRETLARLELWVDPSAGLMEAMRMTFANGDVKVMEFADVATNTPLDESVFSVPK